MKTSLVNKKIIHYLQSIADEGTFYMRKKTGHPVCVASYGGQQRSFTLCQTPNSNYCRYMKARVNQFVRHLPINHTYTFSLKKEQ